MSTSIDSEVFESDDGRDMRRSRRYNRLRLSLRSNTTYMNRNNSNNDTDDDEEEARKRAEEAARLKREEDEARKRAEEAARRKKEEEEAQAKKDKERTEEEPVVRRTESELESNNNMNKANVLTTPISMTPQEQKFLQAIRVTRKKSRSDLDDEVEEADDVDEATKLRKITVDAITKLYSSNMYKQDLTGIKDHKHEHYMLDLLYKNDHTILDEERETMAV